MQTELIKIQEKLHQNPQELIKNEKRESSGNIGAAIYNQREFVLEDNEGRMI